MSDQSAGAIKEEADNSNSEQQSESTGDHAGTTQSVGQELVQRGDSTDAGQGGGAAAGQDDGQGAQDSEVQGKLENQEQDQDDEIDMTSIDAYAAQAIAGVSASYQADQDAAQHAEETYVEQQAQEEPEEEEVEDPSLKLLLSLGNTGDSFLSGVEGGTVDTDNQELPLEIPPQSQTQESEILIESADPSQQSQIRQEEMGGIEEKSLGQIENEDDELDLEIQKGVGDLLASLSAGLNKELNQTSELFGTQDRNEDAAILSTSESVVPSIKKVAAFRQSGFMSSPASTLQSVLSQSATSSHLAPSQALKASSSKVVSTPSASSTSTSSILTAAPVASGPNGTLAPPPSSKGGITTASTTSQKPRTVDSQAFAGYQASDGTIDLDAAIKSALAGALEEVTRAGQEGEEEDTGAKQESGATTQEDQDLASQLASITRAATGLDSFANPLPGNEQSHQKLSTVVKQLSMNNNPSNLAAKEQISNAGLDLASISGKAQEEAKKTNASSIKESDMAEYNHQMSLALSQDNQTTTPAVDAAPRPAPSSTSAPVRPYQKPLFSAAVQAHRPPAQPAFYPMGLPRGGPSGYRPPATGRPYRPPVTTAATPRPSNELPRPPGAPTPRPGGSKPAARPAPNGAVARPLPRPPVNNNTNSKKPSSSSTSSRSLSPNANDSSKKFVCRKCDKSFARAYNLTTHQATHDPDASRSKPHVCPYPSCKDVEGGRSFSRKHDLQRHIASTHEDEEEPGQFGATVEEAIARRKEQGIPDDYTGGGKANFDAWNLTGGLVSLGLSAPGKKFRCESCGRSFVRRDAFSKHKCGATNHHFKRKLPTDSSLSPTPTSSKNFKSIKIEDEEEDEDEEDSDSNPTASVSPTRRISKPPTRSAAVVAKSKPKPKFKNTSIQPPPPAPASTSTLAAPAGVQPKASWSATQAGVSQPNRKSKAAATPSSKAVSAGLYTNSKPAKSSTNAASTSSSTFDPASLGLPPTSQAPAASNTLPEGSGSKSNIEELEKNLNNALGLNTIGLGNYESSMDLNSVPDLQNLANQEGLDDSVKSIISQLLAQKQGKENHAEDGAEDIEMDEESSAAFYPLPPPPQGDDDGGDSIADLVQRTLAAAQASLISTD